MANPNVFAQPFFDVSVMHVFNDFTNFATGTDGWASLASDGGTSVAAGDARKGIAVLTTGATQNNECAIFTDNEIFLFASGKPLYAAAYIQYSEAATNDAAVWFGFSDAHGANQLVDTTGVPKATFDGAAIYKRAEETAWRGVACNGAYATVGSDTLSTTTAGGASYQLLEIIGEEGLPGTDNTFTFRVDGKDLVDSRGARIRHTVLIASATEMDLGVYVKSAGGATGEVVNVDWVYGHQLR